MLSMGDEVRRTQHGNNNAYCQDSPLSWMPWDGGDDAHDLHALVRRLLALRRRHPVFRQQSFFLGRPVGTGPVKDLAWFGPGGEELSGADWFDPTAETIGMYLDGQGIRSRGPQGERVVDDSFLLLLHTGLAAVDVVLPGGPWAAGWQVELDTRAEDGVGAGEPAAGAALALSPRCALLLRARR